MTKLTVFYDGTCPLCAKEMKALKQRDAKQQIKTVDIYSEAFAAYPQIDHEQANTILHALNEKDELLLGLDVTHRAWQLVGRSWLYAPLRWRIIKPVADWLYLKFASNRYRVSYLLTGRSRCNNGSCSR
ncbi:thiol-disulfide oxidoreductase DCC family protein [Vibrio rotiferianus]|uniref:thiol-disulfide oxidoreductase DCC family protein n=1 Tax=Vibrio rotiferianus TaxID=190895 RepID=UPI00406AA45D